MKHAGLVVIDPDDRVILTVHIFLHVSAVILQAQNVSDEVVAILLAEDKARHCAMGAPKPDPERHGGHSGCIRDGLETRSL